MLPWTPIYSPALLGWEGVEIPNAPGHAGAPQPDRIRVVDDPAGGLKRVLRVELRSYRSATDVDPPDGDVQESSGYFANRAEVKALLQPGGAPLSAWPLAVGTERHLQFSYYLAPDWQLTGDGAKWLVLTQLKGLKGGSPPVAVEVKKARMNFVCRPLRWDIGPVALGKWTTLDIRLRLSVGADGWVEVDRDGVPIVPRAYGPTMGVWSKNGVLSPDPVYLKQGIYRTIAWTVTHVAHFGAPVVSDLNFNP